MPSTLVDLALDRAARDADAPFVHYLETGDVDGAVDTLTYAGLVRKAARIATILREHAAAGDRVLLLYPSGASFVAAFFGVLFARMIPVPVYPPDPARPERGLAKLRGIAADCAPRVALTTSSFLPALAATAPLFPELAALTCLASDEHDAHGATDALSIGALPAITADDVALLQYTSGSTGAPKGVVVRHAQLLANQRSIGGAMGPVGVVVGWLPVFHDMGLIGNVLHVLAAGERLVLMSPIAFLKRPARWLEAITRFRGNTGGGPSFAYELCARRVSDDERARLDLSSWQVAFCGAEPVRRATVDNFTRAFAPHGFRSTSFFPCYGLAEATLFVTGNPRGRAPRTLSFEGGDGGGRRELVSCGAPQPGDEVRIVDPETLRACPDGAAGEIWVRGPGVASGYYGNAEATAYAFDARIAGEHDGDDPGQSARRGYLRTGDLGFIGDGELYVTGRRKELIIIAGRNLFPHDIETAVEGAVAGVRAGCCAAFSVDDGAEERLVIAAERKGASVDAAAADADDDLVREIKRAVSEQQQVAVHAVVLLEKGALPKTSSGKIERVACRAMFKAGTLAPAPAAALMEGA